MPDEEELCLALGPGLELWLRLVHFIEEELQVPGEWSFGGKNYGWNRWYRKSGKAVVSLYPQAGGLNAQVVLGKLQVEQARALTYGTTVNRMLQETELYHDGMWLFIPVRSVEDAVDVEQLLRIKRPARSFRQKKQNSSRDGVA